MNDFTRRTWDGFTLLALVIGIFVVAAAVAWTIVLASKLLIGRIFIGCGIFLFFCWLLGLVMEID